MNPLIKETIFDQIDLTELDLDNLAALLGEWEDYDWISTTGGSEKRYYQGGDNLNLDTLQKAIDDLQAKGCTHVQICQHDDHHGYYLMGTTLEVVTGEEATELRKRKLKFEIEAAEGQYEQNKIALAKQMDEIGKMYEEIEKLNGENT